MSEACREPSLAVQSLPYLEGYLGQDRWQEKARVLVGLTQQHGLPVAAAMAKDLDSTDTPEFQRMVERASAAHALVQDILAGLSSPPSGQRQDAVGHWLIEALVHGDHASLEAARSLAGMAPENAWQVFDFLEQKSQKGRLPALSDCLSHLAAALINGEGLEAALESLLLQDVGMEILEDEVIVGDFSLERLGD